MYKVCPKCGSEVSENQNVCGMCGCSLHNEQADNYNQTPYEVPGNPYPYGGYPVTPKKKNTGLIVGTVAAVLLALAIIGLAAERYARSEDNNEKEQTAPVVELESEEKEQPKKKSSSGTEKGMAGKAAEKLNSTQDASEDEDTDVDSKEFALGTISGSSYKNEYFGIGFDLDGWTYADREDIIALGDYTGEYFEDNVTNEEVLDLLAEAENYTDMVATHPDGSTNVNFIVSNNDAAGISSISNEAYVDMMVAMMPEYYSELGVDIKKCEGTHVDVKGGTEYVIYIELEMNGVGLYIFQIFDIKDKHTAVITITSQSLDKAKEVCECFYRF